MTGNITTTTTGSTVLLQQKCIVNIRVYNVRTSPVPANCSLQSTVYYYIICRPNKICHLYWHSKLEIPKLGDSVQNK